MGVYPVGTPAVFELPGASALKIWHFPDDFPTLVSGSPGAQSAVYRTAPVHKGLQSHAYIAMYDRNFQGGTWVNFPAFTFRESDPTGGTIAGGSLSTMIGNLGDSRAMYPSTADWVATPYVIWGTATFGVYSRPDLTHVVATGNWAHAPDDNGYVCLVEAATANSTSEPYSWDGPFTIDCGSGPNRLLLVEMWTWNGPNSGTNPRARVNGTTFDNTFNALGLNPPAATQKFSPLREIRMYKFNPPSGTATLTFDWRQTARGILVVSTYAGVDQTSPLLLVSSTNPFDTPPATSVSLTTASACPMDGYWIGGLISYSTPLATPGSGEAGREIANLTTAGLMRQAIQRDFGAGTPVTTSYTLDSSQIALIWNVMLRWDTATPTPTPTAVPSRLATIVG